MSGDGGPKASLVAVAGLLAVLLASDSVMLALHVAYARTVQGAPTPLRLYDPMFSLSRDGGLAETVEYLKSLATAVLLLRCARRGGGRLFLALAGIHAWFLADNLLRIHERLGALAGHLVAPDGAFTLASRDFGQPIAFAAIGGGLAFMLWRGWRGADAAQRRDGVLLVACAASLVLFAVVADALHASRLGRELGETFWVLLEDGGETVVLSLNCALATAFALAAGVRLWPRGPAYASGEG
jgi:hypothetical protein